jgi:ABC-type multidrug transport system fused ATPase/permease subunit
MILSLLDRNEQRALFILAFITLIIGLFDMIGVASILPFLAVVADPSIIERSGILSQAYDLSGAKDVNGFLQILGTGVFVTVLVSIGVKAVGFYLLTRFTRMRIRTLGMRLFRHYLLQPYEWFLDRHSANLGKTILSEVAEVVNGSITSAAKLMANLMITLCLVVFLLILEPVGAILAALIIGAFFFVAFRLIRKRLAAIGTDRVKANEQRFRITQEAMGGIKEVKLLGLERAYLSRFSDPALRLAQHQTQALVLGELPRYLLEAVAFGAMILFTLWLLSSGGSLAEVLPVLGAFAFAGIRLFPTLQEVFRDLAKLRFSEPALVALHEDLSRPLPAQPRRAGDSTISVNREVRLENVSYAYPGTSHAAVDGVTLDIPAGAKVGFVGSTGAGKTTLFDIILGIIAPTDGRLLVDETPIDNANVMSWQRSIGYVPQSIFLTDDTIAANIALGVPPEKIDRRRIEDVAKQANLHDFVATLPKAYDTGVGEAGVRLSGGQRQRIGIARALYRDPSILLFDEATSALDNVTERSVMDAVHELSNRTVIIVAHRLTTVRSCDKIFMMKAGKLIAAGTYEELIRTSEEFNALDKAARQPAEAISS